MKIKKVDMERPPENFKISIDGNDCKCIKYDSKTWVNIKDLTHQGIDEINRLRDNNTRINDMIIELSLYGQGDYYVEATDGVSVLKKAIYDDNFWY